MSNSFKAHTLTSCLEGDDDIPAIIVTDNGPIYNRKCLREKVLALVLSLSRIGVKRGDNVALSFANDVEFIVLFFAITSLGASAAPLNPNYKTEEVVFYLQDINASLLLIPKNKQNKEAEAAADKMNIRIAYTELDAVSKSVNLSFVIEANQDTHNNNSSEAFPDDIALFLHTSGTTGKPKGVPLSHINMLATMQNITDTYKLTKEDCGYLVMPLFHVHGLMAGVFAPLFARGSIVIPNHSQGFQAHLLWSDIAKYECNWFTAVPTMHQSLLSNLHHYDAAGKPVMRFIRSCSSSLPPSVLVQLEEVFRAPVLEAYAMTEACHQMTSNPLPEENGTIRRKPGSVGRPINVELKVLDTNNNNNNNNINNELAANTVGEVCVKAKNVTRGYHNREDANREAFTAGGFFRTGDLGYLDEDGFLFLTGRIKEQINRGGEKLAPVTIDNILLQCPGVSSLFAFGTPHSELGETVAVVVVQSTTSDESPPLTLQRLNAFGFDHGLAPQWLPSVIVFCDSVPKGPTGKVQRTKLSSLLDLPILSAADGPSAFRYRPGEALERLSTRSEENSYGVEDVNRIEVQNVVGDLIGMDLSQREELLLDSFTAVTLCSNLNSRYGSHLKPKDCLSTTVSAIEIALRTAVSLRLENIVKFVESVLGIRVSHRLDEPLPLDSFSAVQLSSSLKQNYKVNISPQHILVDQFSMKQLQQTILNKLLLTDTGGDVKDQITSPNFFESQATVPIKTLEFLKSATTSVIETSTSTSTSTTTKSVLLTGVTGFLGIHLLDALLGYSEVTKVICLVRSKKDSDEDTKDGLSRIVQQWKSQNISSSPLDTSRVVVMIGDTSIEGWGLQPCDWDTLYSSNVFAIIHNSAVVNHALPYQDLFEANVQSTQSAITLAAQLSIHNKYYCHCAFVSTGGVCGRFSFKDEEEPLRLPAENLLKQNGYVQGKWVSEKLLENATMFLAENNIISYDLVTNPVFSIFRPGALTGHSTTGVCNIGDSINRYLIGWSLLAAAPPLDPLIQVDMSPVDWNAKAIAGIILQNCKVVVGPAGRMQTNNNKLCPVYTLDNGNSKSYNNLIDCISKVSHKSIRLMESYEEWLNSLTIALETENNTYHNEACYPNPLRDLLGSLKTKPPKFGSTSCSKHGDLLESYGFPWPMITDEYITICFQKYNDLGAIPKI